MKSALLIGLIAMLWSSLAIAHQTDVAVSRLTELGEGRYVFAWELEPNKDRAVPLNPIFPAHCALEDRVLDCGSEGLVGVLGFERIGAGQSAAIFKINDLSGQTRILTLTPSAPTVEMSPELDGSTWAGMAEIAAAYTAIGIEHILLGVDHLLFVLGLIWIATRRWMLLKTITAFTIAHSLTLGAVTFGWVGVPEPLVNALIALSIVFIGVEVLRAQTGETSLTLRHPWAVAFGFGLLHGFGFASALVELGLPGDAVPLALLAFNIGVEIGQIAFVFVVLAMAWAYRTMSVQWPTWSQIAPAYAIGSIAAYWFFERVTAMVGA